MPAASPNDFVVPVEGVGSFTFARRTLRLQLALDVEAARLGDGAPVGEELGVFIGALATLKTLTVQAPDGWDPEGADPFDPESYNRVMQVWGALRKEEETFRGKPKG